MKSGIKLLAHERKRAWYFLAWAAAFPLGVALASPAHAASGDAQSQIVSPGTVTSSSDLNFGIILPGTSVSRVRVEEASDSITVASGNAIPAGGSVSRARFDIAAVPLSVVLIGLPTSIQLTRVSGTEQMLLDQFRQNGLPLQIVGTSGVLSFYVGGRLRVQPAQRPGHYQGTFTVTVDFI